MTIAEVSKQYDLTQDTLRYYERVGMIPPVNRTSGGLRDYTEGDLRWVELAKCLRSAGLPVEVMIEYLKLTQEGNETIPARRELLLKQREQLLEQKRAIESTLERLDYKIGRYEKAMETGVLSWRDEE
ncbi:MerR family transcriptional regulator [Papillibacter cinnamivorans]|uniref:DNA-binding transcriptional regulator, MerR family n=1 Tax=Papillibacter cinnamivorans DSM 12816 TaxID=1122930 RepID=A0A1W2CL28_9FIRM|nr:MerR family transcriptional regulator [Papillibacter cinnamivorans]SMC85726.1 DNA-binding transcriptional regulator, MerR family [Papillibacter cinnamivorans DSM 12816]